MEPNENWHYRGLHIAIVDPRTGKPTFAKVFDTYQTCYEFDKFIARDDIPDDNIIIAACKDECVTCLSEAAKLWFERMGSLEIRNLKYREPFVFMAKYRGGMAGEKMEYHLVESVSIT